MGRKKTDSGKKKNSETNVARETHPADSAVDNELNRNVNGPVATCSCYYSGSETPPPPPPTPSRACCYLAAGVSAGGGAIASNTLRASFYYRGCSRWSTNLKKKNLRLFTSSNYFYFSQYRLRFEYIVYRIFFF